MYVSEVHINRLDSFSELPEAQLCIGVGIYASEDGVNAGLGWLLFFS